MDMSFKAILKYAGVAVIVIIAIMALIFAYNILFSPDPVIKEPVFLMDMQKTSSADKQM